MEKYKSTAQRVAERDKELAERQAATTVSLLVMLVVLLSAIAIGMYFLLQGGCSAETHPGCEQSIVYPKDRP